MQPIRGMSFPPNDFETAKDTNEGHDRLETLTITVSSQLKDFIDWSYLEQVFKLERCFISHKTSEVQEQCEYGFTSLSREEISPSHLLRHIRSHWGIENGLHYSRDVTQREDYTRMTQGKTGQVMVHLNNLILGILLSKKK